jgi:hypothetical protein
MKHFEQEETYSAAVMRIRENCFFVAKDYLLGGE